MILRLTQGSVCLSVTMTLLATVLSNYARAFMSPLPQQQHQQQRGTTTMTTRFDSHMEVCDRCIQSPDSICIDDDQDLSSSQLPSPSRTEIVHRRNFLTLSGMFGATTSVLVSTVFSNAVFGAIATSSNVAIVDSSKYTATTTGTTGIQQPQPLSATDIANLLHVVPTFTIVDTDGIPYMVVGEDARVTGYFFTSYDEAQRILTVTKSSVDQSIRDEHAIFKRARITTSASSLPTSSVSDDPDEQLLVNPWKSARISTIPLDVAITLSLKGLTGNVRTYFQVAAASSDINDALEITNKTDLADGKVPLFYLNDFTLYNSTQIPLYFQKEQLTMAYKKQYPKQRQLPTVQVTELFAVLTSMANTNDNTDKKDLQNIIFVPPMNSEQLAKQCMLSNKGKPPFVLGKRNIVL